ncbi:hypothetical protein Tco_0844949 [Tanacetum coccineum]
MERGFLSQKGSKGRRGVKKKNGVAPSVEEKNEAVKDGVALSVMVASGNSNRMQQDYMGQCSSTSPIASASPLSLSQELYVVQAYSKIASNVWNQLKETYDKMDGIWYDVDVHDLRSVENEFPAIVFNDSLTSNETLSCEPTVNQTSLSEYDEEEQNVLYFNALFPFNIVYLDDLKLEKGNDENDIYMIQSSRGNENTNKLLEESHDKINKVFIMKSFVMELKVNILAWNHFVNGMLFILIKNSYVPFGIPFDLNGIIRMVIVQECCGGQVLRDFETRLARIYRRKVHRVQVFDFGGLPDLIAEGLSTRMLMENWDAQGQSVFTSQTWRRLFDIRGPLVHELIMKFFSTFRDPKLRLCLRLITYSIAGRSQAPEKVLEINFFGKEVGGYDILMSVLAGPAWQEGGARGVTEEALVALGGDDEDEEMPQAVPCERITQLEKEVHGMREALQGQKEVLDSMARDFSRFSTWTITSLIWLMDSRCAETRYSESRLSNETYRQGQTSPHHFYRPRQQPDP